MNRILLMISLLAFSSLSFAVSHVSNAKIKSAYCGYEGTFDMCSIEFEDDVVIKTPDNCYTIPNANRMQFKSNTETGKAILSIALSALAADKNVDVYGTGKCEIYPGLSDINYIIIRK